MIVINDKDKLKITLEFGYEDEEIRLHGFLNERLTRIMEAHNTIHKELSQIHDATEKLEKKAMDTELGALGPKSGTIIKPKGLVPVQDNNGSESTIEGQNGILTDTVEAPLPPLTSSTNEGAYWEQSGAIEQKDFETKLEQFDNIDM